ncbi:hypothetical protein ACRAWD_15205 [Caulobacter segnis]
MYYQYGRYLLIACSRVQAASRPTCRGSGTTRRSRPGAASTRSTSTPR